MTRMTPQGTRHVHYCSNCGWRMSHGGPPEACLVQRGLKPPLTCPACGQASVSNKARKAEKRQYDYAKRRRGAYDRA